MLKKIFGLFALTGMLGGVSQASSLYWNGTSSSWGTASNWYTDAAGTIPSSAVPLITDDTVFNITSAIAGETITVPGTINANSLLLVSSGGALIQSINTTSRTFNLGAGGITMNPGAGALTLGGTGNTIAVNLAASQTWNNNSASQLRITNSMRTAPGVNSTLTLTNPGGGNFLFSNTLNDNTGGVLSLVVDLAGAGNVSMASSTYSGGTAIKRGTLTSSGNVGTGTISLGQSGETAMARLNTTGTITGNIVAEAGHVGLLALTTSSGGIFSGNILLNSNLSVGTVASTNQPVDYTGVISGTGNLTAGRLLTGSSNPTVTFGNANTYTGKTIVESATLNVNSFNSVVGGTATSTLGAPTTVANGTISMGSLTLSSTLRYNGTGETTDRVIDLAGTTGGATLDQAGSGLLKFTSAFTATGTGSKTLTLAGVGAGEIAGAIVNGAGTTAVTMAGSNIWTLSGANTYTGTTTVSSGTLKLDANAGGSLASTTNFTLGGGTFSVLGKAGNVTDQTVGTLTLTANTMSNLNVDGGSSTSTTLRLGNLTTNARSTLNINTSNGGAVTTTQTNTNGILGGRIVLNGADFATGNGASSPITAATTTALATSAGTDTLNSLASGDVNMTGTRTTNSLKATTTGAGQALSIGAGNTLALTSGGLLFVGTNDYSIADGILKSNTATNSDLTIHQYGSGALTIGSVIANGNGTSTVTKVGTGTLILTGTNTYSGATQLNQGVLQLGNGTSGKDGSIASNIVNNTSLVYNIAGSTTYTAVVSGTGSVTKTGAGTQTLSGTNTYTGSTTVNSGTLLVSGGITGTSGVTVSGGTFAYSNNGAALNRAVTVAGGNFKYNSTAAYSGALTFTSGTISGTGNLSGTALSIGTGKTMAPGNSTGAQSVGATTWADGGTFQFELNDATGTAGSTSLGWDLANAASLNVTAGTSLFTLQLLTLDAAQSAGMAANFNSGSSYSWMFVDSGSAITNFAPNQFVLNTSGFQNSFAGTFSVSQGTGIDDDKLFLNYTAVPEPSPFVMALGGLVLLQILRRRKR